MIGQYIFALIQQLLSSRNRDDIAKSCFTLLPQRYTNADLKISQHLRVHTISSNSYDQECEIFRALFLYELEYMGRFLNLYQCTFNPLSVNPIKWSNTLKTCRLLPTNCLNVFDHFLGSALKGLTSIFTPLLNVGSF